MKKNKLQLTALAIVLIATLNACDRTSSPEGRISIKLEQLQQEMRDSMKKQNAAMLDSLGKIREELQNLQQTIKK